MEEKGRDREVEGSVGEGQTECVRADRGRTAAAEIPSGGQVPPLPVERHDAGTRTAPAERDAEAIRDRAGTGADVEDPRGPADRPQAWGEVAHEHAVGAPAAVHEVDVLERAAHLLGRKQRVVEKLAARPPRGYEKAHGAGFSCIARASAEP